MGRCSIVGGGDYLRIIEPFMLHVLLRMV